MKSERRTFIIVLLMLFVLLHHGGAIGQSLDSTLAYFPMAVGNVWEYSRYWGMTAPTQFQGYCFMRITGDTVMSNGRQFFVLRGGSSLYDLFTDPAYLRLDSSTANVKSYDPTHGQEYTWDSLLARVGQGGPHHGLIVIRNDSILGTPTVTRTYVTTFDGVSLSYGFGVTGSGYIDPSQESYSYKLVYAKIGNVEYGTLLGVADPIHNIPARFELLQNFPNPFNPSTTIPYFLPQRSHVTLSVFNTLGQKVATLVNAVEEPGYHEVQFDGSGLASGVYFYRMQAGSFVQAHKLLLLR